MEPRTVLLYLSVVLNLLLSGLLAGRENPSTSSATAPARNCCPCPAASVAAAAPEAPTRATIETAAATPPTADMGHTATSDAKADPTFTSAVGGTYGQDMGMAVPPAAMNATFDFMEQPCAQRKGGRGLYFVDLGANCGNSYELFVRRILPTLKRPDKASALRAFLFEFNPRMHRDFLDPLQQRDPRVKVIKAAAHVQDGTFTAYLDNRREAPGQFRCIATPGARNPAGASTLVGAMPRAGRPITVATLSIPKFLNNTFCPGDEVYLKMDIEGFEYPLLSAMIEQRVHCVAAAYYIEFHFKLPQVEFLGRNMTPAVAAGEARRQLRECATVREWF